MPGYQYAPDAIRNKELAQLVAGVVGEEGHLVAALMKHVCQDNDLALRATIFQGIDKQYDFLLRHRN